MPGFVQSHVHLCQTLFRGVAEDLPLLPWLRDYIWPLEAAHTPESLLASTRMACAELLRGGTVGVLTMETTRYSDAVAHGVQILTIGQYLQPTAKHHPVIRYVEPIEFDEYARIGRELGLEWVESGPMVRSSYHAREQSDGLADERDERAAQADKAARDDRATAG